MKKLLLSILFIFSFITARSQFLPFVQVDDVPYLVGNDFETKLIIIDSTIYEIRSGGLHSKNVVTQQDDYHWAYHYRLRIVIPDKNQGYIFLKDDSYIGVYDSTTQNFVDINDGALMSNIIRGIDMAPNGNIWAVGSQELAIYNGFTWIKYLCNNARSLNVIDDTSAYILNYNNSFMLFHNGVFDSINNIPANLTIKDWDTDSIGNLWIAANNQLISRQGSNVMIFDSTNSPIGNEKFLKVRIANDGNIWTCGEKQNLFMYDGVNWTTYSLPGANIYIDDFCLDSLNRPWLIGGTHSFSLYLFTYTNIYALQGSSFNSPISFSFNPYKNVKEVSLDNLATDEGNFKYNSSFFDVGEFWGNPENPEASDINCYVTNYGYQGSFQNYYGTNNGVYYYSNMVAYLDSSVLPNDTVNCIAYFNGSHYVCTNDGLLIYNGVFYNTLNTTNSVLPSDKITFAAIVNDQQYNKILIGTANGIAMYKNNQWTVMDSTDFGLSSCYVTGIWNSPYDTTTYITTMGSGLIKLFDSGGYQLYNTSNGNLLDDSLYYVVSASLGKCGEYILMGSKHNGVAIIDYWNSWDTLIQFHDTINGIPFTQSTAGLGNYYSMGKVLIATDNGLFWASLCGGISEENYSLNMKVFPNPSSGKFSIECNNMSDIEIHNVVGEMVYKSKATGPITVIDMSDQSKGIYFIRVTDLNNKVSNNKIIIQ